MNISENSGKESAKGQDCSCGSPNPAGPGANPNDNDKTAAACCGAALPGSRLKTGIFIIVVLAAVGVAAMSLCRKNGLKTGAGCEPGAEDCEQPAGLSPEMAAPVPLPDSCCGNK